MPSEPPARQTETSRWKSIVGGVLVATPIVCVSLVAAGGWPWFVQFLSGPAANWVQAVGSLVAIGAAFKIGQSQVDAGRLLEAAKRAHEDSRRLVIIDAILGNLDRSLKPLRDGLERYKIPARKLCLLEQIQNSLSVVKAVDLFACPAVNVIPILTLVPILGDDLLQAIDRYDRSKRPGATVVRTSRVDIHHGIARFTWHVIQANGVVLPEGLDIAFISTCGNYIEKIVGFFGPLSGATSQ